MLNLQSHSQNYDKEQTRKSLLLNSKIKVGLHYKTTVSLLYDLAGGSACRRGPYDLHCISPLISL